MQDFGHNGFLAVVHHALYCTAATLRNSDPLAGNKNHSHVT